MFFVANFFKYLFQCIEISSLNYDMNCDIWFRFVHLTCFNRKNWHPILVEYVHPWILFHYTERTLAHLTKIKKNFQSWIIIFFLNFQDIKQHCYCKDIWIQGIWYMYLHMFCQQASNVICNVDLPVRSGLFFQEVLYHIYWVFKSLKKCKSCFDDLL